MFACILVLGSREKKKVPVNLIKNFNANKHVPTQKYKLVGENPSTQCIILFLKDTEEELDKQMGMQRIRQPSQKLLQSATESTDEDELPFMVNNRKRKEEVEGDPIENALKKRLQVLHSEHNKENENEARQDVQTVQQKQDEILKQCNRSVVEGRPDVQKAQKSTSNLQLIKSPSFSNAEDAKEICKKCEKTEHNAKLMKRKVALSSQEIDTMKEEVHLLEEELMKSKEALQILQEDVRHKDEELNTLRSLNVHWQKLGIEKYEKLEDVHMAAMEAPSTSGGGGGQFPPIGSITPDGSQIHIGRGLYLSTQAWYLALNVPTTRKITFARNILVALCGYDYLSRVTVSGKGSNRNRQSQQPEFKLDPKILLAIRDVYSYFLVSEKMWKKDEADVEAGRVHSVISKKIADVKKAKKKAYDPKVEKTVMGDAQETIAEGNSDVQEDIDSYNSDHDTILQIDEVNLLEVTSDEEITKSDGNDSSSLVITTDTPSLEKDEEILRIINGESTNTLE